MRLNLGGGCLAHREPFSIQLMRGKPLAPLARAGLFLSIWLGTEIFQKKKPKEDE